MKTVSQLADSSRSWARGGVKEYSSIVVLDGTPPIPIKPGMNAEVEINVDYLEDVICVPVQAVTEHKHQHFVYVKNGSVFERKTVEIGQSNNRMVEISSGLEEGAEVALDARARGIIDFEDEEIEVENDSFANDESDLDESESDVKESESDANDSEVSEESAGEDSSEVKNEDAEPEKADDSSQPSDEVNAPESVTAQAAQPQDSSAAAAPKKTDEKTVA